MIQVGVLGYGYWGPNLVRVFQETRGVRVKSVADPLRHRLEAAQTISPGLRVSVDPYDLLRDPGLDAIVVATPVATHAELATAALRAGKHVLVEKPLAATSEEAAELIREAEDAHRMLMVDHTFVYTSAVREICRLVEAGEIGRLVFYRAARSSLGRLQPEVGVLWDLAVHDLAIFDTVSKSWPIEDSPVAVSASALSLETLSLETPSLGEQPLGAPARPDVAQMTLHFAGPRAVHIHVDWVAAMKVRRTQIVGIRGTIVYDDSEPSDKVKVYEVETDEWPGLDAEGDASQGLAERRVAHRAGRMTAPRLSVAEPLRTMAAHFVECVETGRKPDSDGASALRVLRWLEAADASIATGGRPVILDPVIPDPVP